MKTHEDFAGKLLERNVKFLLPDPSCNLTYKLIMVNSSHDVCTREYMTDLVELKRKIVTPGEHGHLFCTWMQFSQWYSRLRRIAEDVTGLEADLEGDICIERNVLEVESVPSQYIHEHWETIK